MGWVGGGWVGVGVGGGGVGVWVGVGGGVGWGGWGGGVGGGWGVGGGGGGGGGGGWGGWGWGGGGGGVGGGWGGQPWYSRSDVRPAMDQPALQSGKLLIYVKNCRQKTTPNKTKTSFLWAVLYLQVMLMDTAQLVQAKQAVPVAVL